MIILKIKSHPWQLNVYLYKKYNYKNVTIIKGDHKIGKKVIEHCEDLARVYNFDLNWSTDLILTLWYAATGCPPAIQAGKIGRKYAIVKKNVRILVAQSPISSLWVDTWWDKAPNPCRCWLFCVALSAMMKLIPND